jgi:membrane protein involved in colicin uptake
LLRVPPAIFSFQNDHQMPPVRGLTSWPAFKPQDEREYYVDREAVDGDSKGSSSVNNQPPRSKSAPATALVRGIALAAVVITFLVGLYACVWLDTTEFVGRKSTEVAAVSQPVVKGNADSLLKQADRSLEQSSTSTTPRAGRASEAQNPAPPIADETGPKVADQELARQVLEQTAQLEQLRAELQTLVQRAEAANREAEEHRKEADELRRSQAMSDLAKLEQLQKEQKEMEERRIQEESKRAREIAEAVAIAESKLKAAMSDEADLKFKQYVLALPSSKARQLVVRAQGLIWQVINNPAQAARILASYDAETRAEAVLLVQACGDYQLSRYSPELAKHGLTNSTVREKWNEAMRTLR